MISPATRTRDFQKFTNEVEEGDISTASTPKSKDPPQTTPAPLIHPSPLDLSFGWNPLFLRRANSYFFGHPAFTPEPGRVTQGFEIGVRQREWQAEQILKSLEKWPPLEDGLYVIQIDQDNPPPPPPRPGTNASPEKFREWAKKRREAILELQRFYTQYTGQTVVFRVQRVNGKLRFVELNPNGPLRSASHVSDFGGQGDCNGTICGIAWLRSGIYLYGGRTRGVFNPVQDSLMDVARDSNNNGAIDWDELIRSSRAYGFAIQMHAGFPNSPRGDGCQTFPPDDFHVLQGLIKNANVDSFFYVLVRRPNDRTGPYILI